MEGQPHFGPFHLLSFAFIGGGFVLIANAWSVLYEAQRQELTLTGPYAHLRHPQYAGFILVMFGFLLQWPTLLTLVMFPVLVWMYVRLARSEEREAEAEFGETYRAYARRVPALLTVVRARTWAGRPENHPEREIDNDTEVFASDRTCSALLFAASTPLLAQDDDEHSVHHPEAQAERGQHLPRRRRRPA